MLSKSLSNIIQYFYIFPIASALMTNWDYQPISNSHLKLDRAAGTIAFVNKKTEAEEEIVDNREAFIKKKYNIFYTRVWPPPILRKV